MIKCSKTVRNILTYLLIASVVYLSGNIFFMEINYSNSVIGVTVFSLIVLIICGNFNKYNHIKSIIYILSLFICMLLTILLNTETNIQSYIAIALQIFIAQILSNIIIFDEFEKIYIRILTFLATVSLICFIISQIYPQIVYLFPKTDSIGSVDYYNAYIYVFHVATGFESLVLTIRNSGIFWEPGAYQAFINVGLYFLFDLYKKGYKFKNQKLIILIFIITVLTTYSTTGYIITALILLSNIKILVNIFIKNKKDILIVLLILFITTFSIILIYPNRNEGTYNIKQKIINEFSNGGSGALKRISLDKLDYLFYSGKLNLLGMSFTEFERVGDGCANSIIHTIITLGIPFTTIILVGYFYFAKKMLYNPLLFISILIMIFSAESLLWRPMFIYFIFSSIYLNKENLIINEYKQLND